ncbi:pentapeptide repeat-containing protein [Nonomuraea sp. NPDC049419]|uniref:pentapeptide repeat-containing protein n=1 Tax=Nonomuraea sp. NPDC049419 TaxID=3155772 RepID=UPI003422A879
MHRTDRLSAIRADPRRADLRRADLRRADLRRAGPGGRVSSCRDRRGAARVHGRASPAYRTSP